MFSLLLLFLPHFFGSVLVGRFFMSSLSSALLTKETENVHEGYFGNFKCVMKIKCTFFYIITNWSAVLLVGEFGVCVCIFIYIECWKWNIVFVRWKFSHLNCPRTFNSFAFQLGIYLLLFLTINFQQKNLNVTHYLRSLHTHNLTRTHIHTHDQYVWKREIVRRWILQLVCLRLLIRIFFDCCGYYFLFLFFPSLCEV